MTKFVRLNQEGRSDFFVDAMKVSMFWSIDAERTMIVVDGEYVPVDMPINFVLRAFSDTR